MCRSLVRLRFLTVTDEEPVLVVASQILIQMVSEQKLLVSAVCPESSAEGRSCRFWSATQHRASTELAFAG